MTTQTEEQWIEEAMRLAEELVTAWTKDDISGTAQEALRAHLATRPAVPEGWVSVDARLPDPGVRVLVYVPSCDLLAIQADEWNLQRECPVEWSSASIESGYGWDEHELDEVTHWHALPKAPIAAATGSTK